MKKVLFMIAQEGFRDEELLKPKEILEKAEIEVTVASENKGKATGSRGAVVEAQLSFDESNVDDYEAIIMAGGPGCPKLAFNERVMEILREAKLKEKLLCAICIAPMVFSQAGVLTCKKATVFNTEESLQAFSDNSTEYVDQDVVEDDYAITANGPDAAKAFGEAIAKKLREH
jgi:protease I